MENKFEHVDTQLVKESSHFKHHFAATPIHKGSTALYKNVTEMDAALNDKLKNTFPAYGRFGTPTCREFEYIISKMEKGFNAICTASGLSAISSLFLACLSKWF
ncbi:PLP-dependent transferase [Marinagarivorans algicola]|uniref:PLP-dependent transferase n=1 Tax=Marinagarivorans algicola TaxID=1513270 RepID=UPI0037356706